MTDISFKQSIETLLSRFNHRWHHREQAYELHPRLVWLPPLIEITVRVTPIFFLVYSENNVN